MNAQGEPEVLQPNRLIKDIPGAVVVDLEFDEQDLARAEWEARQASNVVLSIINVKP